MRTILVSRSSREKPKPLDKWVRTTSPSRMVTCRPCSISMTVRMSAMVLLPALGKPVNQTQKPCLLRAGYAEQALLVARGVRRTQDLGGFLAREPGRQQAALGQVIVAHLRARNGKDFAVGLDFGDLLVAVFVGQVDHLLVG